MNFFSGKVRRPNPAFWWIVGVALLAGAGAGWIAAGLYVSPRLLNLEQISYQPPAPVAATSTAPAVQIIPVVQEPAGPSQYPSHFLSQRVSAVVSIYKKGAVTAGEETLIAEDHEIGRAIALTSDGWLVTTYANLHTLRIADLVVGYQGKAYPITQAVRDTATDAVFIKTDAADLPVVAFVDPENVQTGLGVWMESGPSHLTSQTVLDTRTSAQIDPVSSERASRRFLVSADGATVPGGAVWDASGQLIGVLESKSADGWRVLPAGDIRQAFSSLISDRVIKHAVLGVRAVDLSRVTVQSSDRTLPSRGAWLHADKRNALPAVTANGPAAKGLREGDVIDRIERDILDGNVDVGELLLAYRPGAVVSVEGTRKGVPFTVSVTLGSAVTGENLK